MLLLKVHLNYIVSVGIINNFEYFLYLIITFNSIMSFAMLHGIKVLSLIKAVKCYLCRFVRISNTFLLQIKVCNVMIRLSWLVWFMAYNTLMKYFFKYQYKNKYSRTNATEKVGTIALYGSA